MQENDNFTGWGQKFGIPIVFPIFPDENFPGYKRMSGLPIARNARALSFNFSE